MDRLDQNRVAVSKVLLPKEMFARSESPGGVDSSIAAATASSSSTLQAATAPKGVESAQMPPRRAQRPPRGRCTGQNTAAATDEPCRPEIGRRRSTDEPRGPELGLRRSTGVLELDRRGAAQAAARPPHHGRGTPPTRESRVGQCSPPPCREEKLDHGGGALEALGFSTLFTLD